MHALHLKQPQNYSPIWNIICCESFTLASYLTTMIRRRVIRSGNSNTYILANLSRKSLHMESPLRYKLYHVVNPMYKCTLLALSCVDAHSETDWWVESLWHGRDYFWQFPWISRGWMRWRYVKRSYFYSVSVDARNFCMDMIKIKVFYFLWNR